MKKYALIIFIISLVFKYILFIIEAIAPVLLFLLLLLGII